jgi:hypothetical protein
MQKLLKIGMIRYDQNARWISKSSTRTTVLIVLSALILFIQTVQSEETIAVDENSSDNIKLSNDNGK